MDSFRYVVALIACAFAMGTVFDIYNTVTGSTKWLRWLRPVMDVVFWFLSACVVYYAAFITDQGKLRVYTLTLLLIGYGLYYLLAHRIVVRGAYGVVRFVRGLVRVVMRVISVLIVTPIRFLLVIVFGILRWIYRVLRLVEDGLCKTVRIALWVVWYPASRFWPKDAAWVAKLQRRWEDFWMWLSNRIANHSERI